MQSIRPSLKSVKKLLQNASWNPREPGPLKFLVETANVEFYELQVIILMKQAAELRKTIKELSNLPELDSTLCLSILEKQRRYKEIMVLAHQHLVLAEIFSDDPNAI